MGALDDKVAVVTGAASGIGKAAAMLLASHGAKVVVVDVNADGAREVAGLVGGRAVVADVANPEHWAPVVDAARSLGGVYAAYFNAGVTTGEPDIAALSDDQYRRIMAVNIDGVVFGARALLPDMVSGGGGAMVVTSSLAGIVAFPGDPMYTLTKYALIGFVRSIAPRLLESGSRSTPCARDWSTRRSSTARSATPWRRSTSPSSRPTRWPPPPLAACSGQRPVRRSWSSSGASRSPTDSGGRPGPGSLEAEGKVPPGVARRPGSRFGSRRPRARDTGLRRGGASEP